MLKFKIMELNQFVKLNEKLKNLKYFTNDSKNIFRILKIGHKEIYHSNFLAWLFDFKSNPSIAPLLLNKLMEKIYNPSNLKSSTIQPLFFTKNSNQVVHREKNHTDLIVEFPNEKRVIVFENKIYAKESKDQLSRYRKLMDESYSKINEKFKLTYVYFTLNNDAPSDSTWQPVGFDTLLDILNSIKNELNGHRHILEYIELLEEDLMGKENNEKRDFAIKIIRDYSEELKYLFELSNDESEFRSLLKNYKNPSKIDNLTLISLINDLIITNQFDKNIQVIRKSKTYFNFFTQNIYDTTGDYGTGEWLGKNNKYWVTFEFNSKNSNDFRLILVIGPTKGKFNQRLTEFLMNNPNFEGKTLFTKNNKIINDYYNSVNVFKCAIPNKANLDEIKTIIENQLKHFFSESLPRFNRYFEFHSKIINNLIESKD